MGFLKALTAILLLLFLQACTKNEISTPKPSTQASFSYIAGNNAIAPCQVIFINQSVNALSYTWHFGTGDSLVVGNKDTLEYTYNLPGTYTAKLKAQAVDPGLHYNKLTDEKVVVIHKKPVKRLFFTDRTENKVKFIALDEGEIPIIESFPSASLNKPYGMHMDTTHGKLFVMDYGAQLLNRFNWDGVGHEILMNSTTENFNSPIGIIVIENKIYWGEPGGIHRASLDGSDPEVFAAIPGEFPQDLAYDHINQEIYFSNDITPESGGIWKIGMDGTGLKLVVPEIWGGAIEVYPEINKLYYFSGNQGMYLCDLEGKNAVLFDASNAGKWAWGMAIDKEEQKIYYPNRADMTIMRANTDGSHVEVFIPALANINPNAMTIDTYR